MVSLSNHEIGGPMKRLALLAVGLMFAASAHAADKVSFGTDWKAQAEHGGFYQAIAAGLYEKHGLDVTLRPGGPQVNHAQLLAAGRLDFNMSSNSFIALNYVKESIPMVTVAAMFTSRGAKGNRVIRLYRSP